MLCIFERSRFFFLLDVFAYSLMTFAELSGGMFSSRSIAVVELVAVVLLAAGNGKCVVVVVAAAAVAAVAAAAVAVAVGDFGGTTFWMQL